MAKPNQFKKGSVFEIYFNAFRQTLTVAFDSMTNLRDDRNKNVQRNLLQRGLHAASLPVRLIPEVGLVLSAAMKAASAAYGLSREKKHQKQKAIFLASLYAFSEEKRRLEIDYIASKATYRWSSWLQRLEGIPEARGDVLAFAGLGVTRMLAYALDPKNNVSFTDTEAMLSGLVKAKNFESFRNEKFNSITNFSGGGHFTMEGAYARSALCIVDEKLPTSTLGKFCLSRETKLNKTSQTPKYGHILVNLETLNHLSPGYSTMTPQLKQAEFRAINPKSKVAKDAISSFQKMSFRYITLFHIAEYLKTDCKLSFNEWLFKHGRPKQKGTENKLVPEGKKNSGKEVKKNSGKEGKKNSGKEGKKKVAQKESKEPQIRAIIATKGAVIDGTDDRFKNFDKGDFSNTDLSGTTFKNLKLGKLKISTLRFCKFERIEASEDVLIEAALGGSVFANCNLAGLDLFQIEFAYCKIKNCDFSNAKRTSVLDSDQATAEIDASTKQTMDQNLLNFASRSEAELQRQIAEVKNQLSVNFSNKMEEATKGFTKKFDKIEAATKEQNVMVNRKFELINKDKQRQEQTKEETNKKILELQKEIGILKTITHKETVTGETNVEDKEIMTAEQVAELPSLVKIDYSGKNGFDGRAGASFGQSGTDGSNGEDAHKIQRMLLVNETTGVVVIRNRNAEYGSDDYLRLGDPNAQLILRANGGKGGDGGAGAAGFAGRDGQAGQNATTRSAGGDGTSGENGGPGGNGGRGGDGGAAATIEITVPRVMDTDALMYIDRTQLSCEKGLGGKGGRLGAGGAGGKGGAGGNSYSWQETETYRDNDGNKRTRTINHHNQGGRAGRDGFDGRPGQEGTSGRDGHAARIRWAVGLPGKAYDSLYDLDFFRDIPPQVMPDDGLFDDPFIEPGQRGLIERIALVNLGHMPSPSHSMSILINSNLTDDAIIFNQESKLTVKSSIAGKKPMIVPGQLNFSVVDADDFQFPFNHRLVRQAEIFYDLRLNRVQRSFQTPNNFRSGITIQYPLSISTLSQSSKLITPNGQLFFSSILYNHSKSKRYGVLSEVNPRQVEITFQVADETKSNGAISLLALTNDQKQGPFTLDKPVTRPVDSVQPGSGTDFVGLLNIDPEKVKGDESFDFHMKLWLQAPESKRKEGESQPGEAAPIIAIQKMTLSVRLALPYVYNPKASFILITNEATPKSLLNSWSEFAHSLGTSISVWNASLYNGFGYEQARVADGNSFYKQLAEKVVVVFNNSYQHNYDSYGNEVRALDRVSPLEVYSAARYANVRTCIISDQSNCFDFMNEFSNIARTESISFLEKESSFSSSQEAFFRFVKKKEILKELKLKDAKEEHNAPPYCLTGLDFGPSSQDEKKLDIYRPLAVPVINKDRNDKELLKIATSIGKKTEKLFPKSVYSPVVVYNDPSNDTGCGCFRQKASIGRVEFRKLIDANDARLAVTSAADKSAFRSIRPRDKFVVLKLLPFYVKLTFIDQKVLSNPLLSNILLSAILSDLTDEILIYMQGKKMSQNEIRPRLLKFKQLFNFEEKLIKQPAGLEFIRNILVHLELIAVKKEPKVTASKLLEKMVKELKLKYLNQSKQEKSAFHQQRKELKNEYGSGDKHSRSNMILRQHSRPYDSGQNALTRFNTDLDQLRLARKHKYINKDEIKPRSTLSPSFSFSDNNCSFWRYGSKEQARVNSLKSIPSVSTQPYHFANERDRVNACLEECDIEAVPTTSLMASN